MGAFYQLMAVFIGAPWLAAVPGAALLAVWAATGRRLVLAAAAAWLFYLLYEYGMKWRLLCGGECNIRLDLLLLYPALVALSSAAAISAALALVRGRG
jgi:hypothetical protein